MANPVLFPWRWPDASGWFTFECRLLQDLHGVELVGIRRRHLSNQEHLQDDKKTRWVSHGGCREKKTPKVTSMLWFFSVSRVWTCVLGFIAHQKKILWTLRTQNEGFCLSRSRLSWTAFGKRLCSAGSCYQWVQAATFLIIHYLETKVTELLRENQCIFCNWSAS